MKENFLKEFLDKKVDEYNQPSFIIHDPISIPHLFAQQQDIEIAGFFAAIFAWGNRKTIIQKCKELLQRMDNAPFNFIKNHRPRDLKRLLGFKHRTFNEDDLLYFIAFLHRHYQTSATLETAFIKGFSKKEKIIGPALNNFYHYFFSLDDCPKRTTKHIASPQKKSTCKRLNMFLRWMVRHDKKGVDFGIWKNILPAQLICPVDVHVARVATKIKILQRKQVDWQAALDLTSYLRRLDEKDPVKYDFALFGLGAMEKF